MAAEESNIDNGDRISKCSTYSSPFTFLPFILAGNHETDLPGPNVLPNDSPLHTVIRAHDSALLQKVLSERPWLINNGVDIPGDNGETPLHLACVLNDLEAVKILLAHGANPDRRRKCFHNLHPVHLAAAAGAIDVLTFFVEEWPRENNRKSSEMVAIVDSEGSTPLHWAVLRRWLHCVEFLLKHGARLDQPQTQGFRATPLSLACCQGLVGMLQPMLDISKPSFMRALELPDDEGLKPMHRAAVLNAMPVLEFLVENGADVNIRDVQGRTPIMMASSAEAWAVVKFLALNGGDPFQPDRLGRTSIHYGAIYGTFPTPEENIIIQDKTISEKLTQSIDRKDKLGFTALHYAAAHGHAEVFNRLIACKADWTIKSDDRKSVLHFAAECGTLPLVQRLLANADLFIMVNDTDANGDSPLTLAVNHGYTGIVELLISKGALTFRDLKGRTCLHSAAARGYCDIIGLVYLQFPKILDYVDINGDSALHVAALHNSASSISCLMSKGAKFLFNNQKRTAIDIVIAEKNTMAALAFVRHDRWREVMAEPSEVYGSVGLGLTRYLPDVMKVVMDRCVTTSPLSTLDKDFYVLYDFSIIEPQNSEDVVIRSQRRSKKLLKEIARLHRPGLTVHPLSRALLDRKWRLYGMFAYNTIFTSYLVFLAMLSYVVISTTYYHLTHQIVMRSYRNIRNFSHESSQSPAFQTLLNESYRIYARSEEYRPSWQACSVIILCIMTILGVKEGLEFYSKGWRYFLDVVNYLEIFTCACCVTYIGSLLFELTQNVELPLTGQMGALTIFLAWFNLLRYCQPYGVIGIYAVMFFSVLKTLIKVAVFFFILLAAFTVTFYQLIPCYLMPDNELYYILLQDAPKASDLMSAHFNIWSSGLRIGAMTIGDMDTRNNFIDPFIYGKLPFPIMTYGIVVLFLLMMPILLNNLLTGLAVGDIKNTQENATEVCLKNQIEMHESVEQLIPERLNVQLREKLQSYKFYPNRRPSLLDRVTRLLSGNTGDVVISHFDEQELYRKRADEQQELAHLRIEVQQLKTRLSKRQAMALGSFIFEHQTALI
ncbi:Transient receptor potential cation channel subfamily A member 1 [Hypsibius exemplaris]|uniref:Transient receptor potential cation channel subfamily A member 1 n=1 Tax=Hypsibius exemplaris TaxID=2072580 RepID=A0A1W0WDZ6_HYPEX|nr:Transient receptor potential cation channel subfamily A member 1 [Hypsibius exemplaris]